jgi:hypothetical protein
MLCTNYKNISDFLAEASLHKKILIILALYVMLCVNYKEHINLPHCLGFRLFVDLWLGTVGIEMYVWLGMGWVCCDARQRPSHTHLFRCIGNHGTWTLKAKKHRLSACFELNLRLIYFANLTCTERTYKKKVKFRPHRMPPNA